jgi:hypothetical protein
MDSLVDSEAVGLPVACTLGTGDGAQRMQRSEALSLKGRPSTRRCGHQLVVAYRAEPGVREELEALVAAERQCCSFVAWDAARKRTASSCASRPIQVVLTTWQELPHCSEPADRDV